jgi:hypothetical protein
MSWIGVGNCGRLFMGWIGLGTSLATKIAESATDVFGGERSSRPRDSKIGRM